MLILCPSGNQQLRHRVDVDQYRDYNPCRLENQEHGESSFLMRQEGAMPIKIDSAWW